MTTNPSTQIWQHAHQLISQGSITEEEVRAVLRSYKSLAPYARIIAAIDEMAANRPEYLYEYLMRCWNLPAEAVFYWMHIRERGFTDDPKWRQERPIFREQGLPILIERGWVMPRYSKNGALLELTVTEKMPRSEP
jgi:hypothetical protein